jgi:protein disulfide-isomerase-like protein
LKFGKKGSQKSDSHLISLFLTKVSLAILGLKKRSMQCILFLFFALLVVASATDIVTLDANNFESLTQAATGATTGDWLVKFYAPWCGHCKSMQPAYEEVATALLNEVNVAEVDVTQSRSLGTRFDIKGFPTMLFLSKGQVYKFSGARTKDKLIEFVRGGYNDPVVEKEATPAELGYFGEVTKVFSASFKAAKKDIDAGNYMTMNILTCVMPVLFLVFAALLALIPVDDEPYRRRAPTSTPAAGTPANIKKED